MDCQICKKKLGEYQCSVCKKLVCEDHHKTIDGKVYCTEHLPKEPGRKQGIKKAIITVFILLVGVVSISYILEYYIGASPMFSDVAPLMAGFTTIRTMVSMALTAILILLLIAYFFTKK